MKTLVHRAGLQLEALLRPRTRPGGHDVSSVLVLEYTLPLGSCIHMTPLYEAIKRSRPEVTVIVATRGLGLQVLRHSPFVDHLIETPNALEDTRATVTSLKRQLAERGLDPDCCLTGMPDQRSRIALVAMQVCRGWRGGFTVHPELYQRPLVVDKSLSQIANNLRLLPLLGASSGLLEPKVFFSAADAARASDLFAPLRHDGRPVIAVVSQNSGGQRTGWHQDRWVAVLRHASEQHGASLVFLGTAGDVNAIDQLREAAGSIGMPLGASLAGQTSVNELAAVVSLSDLILSLDTGTMHVGRAAATPMVVLGPSWQKPVEWLPLGQPQVRILRGPDRSDVPEGYMLDEINAPSVIHAMDELISLYPPSGDARSARLEAGISPAQPA